MATWQKVKFFYATMLGSTGSTLAADSTASGDYDVDYIFNMLETNMWKSANTTDPQYITYDAGAGNTVSADYLVILGHNLSTISATVTLQYSTDNFSGDINDAYTAEAPSADTVYIKEFTTQDKRYWRLKISGAPSAAPQITLAIWGAATELDYASTQFDPHAQQHMTTRNISQGGVVTGVHQQYIERSMALSFFDADSTLYGKVKSWIDDNGLKNFFVGWELGNNTSEVFLMRSDASFNNPLKLGGAYRNININLVGRKEGS